VLWWILLGALIAGVVILVLTVSLLAKRLRPLGRAVRRLRLRAEQAERMQEKIVTVQQNVDVLQRGMVEATARAERLTSRPPSSAEWP
jgi:Sec-independent protein translocase protein TatA